MLLHIIYYLVNLEAILVNVSHEFLKIISENFTLRKPDIGNLPITPLFNI